MDTFSRVIVGWSAATNKQTPLILSALEMGLWRRERDGQPVLPRELIHHNDTGSQYTSFPSGRLPGRGPDRRLHRLGRRRV
ncbi:hypothetical protein [Streptomyces sp. NPDC058572]|uniref:hypothetical protein n=1 Tax=Streptomyces sp. NPDC058572 TaxID=3346546 RepID=UPI003654CEC3